MTWQALLAVVLCLCIEATGLWSAVKRQGAVLDVVIPFYERETCKLQVQLNSIVRFDPPPERVFGVIYLIWVSRLPLERHMIEMLQRPPRNVTVLSLQELCTPKEQAALQQRVRIVRGGARMLTLWNEQQMAKLLVSRVVKSTHYLVLDTKNILTSLVQLHDYIDVHGRARTFASDGGDVDNLPRIMRPWALKAMEVLKVPPSFAHGHPAMAESVTPFVMETKTVLDMLEAIERLQPPARRSTGLMGRLQPVGSRWTLQRVLDAGATEFTLYDVFARSQPNFSEKYILERRPISLLVATFFKYMGRVQTKEDDSGCCLIQQSKQICEGQHGLPTMAGFQIGTLPVNNKNVVHCLFNIFHAMNLTSGHTHLSFARCMS